MLSRSGPSISSCSNSWDVLHHGVAEDVHLHHPGERSLAYAFGPPPFDTREEFWRRMRFHARVIVRPCATVWRCRARISFPALCNRLLLKSDCFTFFKIYELDTDSPTCVCSLAQLALGQRLSPLAYASRYAGALRCARRFDPSAIIQLPAAAFLGFLSVPQG